MAMSWTEFGGEGDLDVECEVVIYRGGLRGLAAWTGVSESRRGCVCAEGAGGLCANFIVSHVNIGGCAVVVLVLFFVGIRDMRRSFPERD